MFDTNSSKTPAYGAGQLQVFTGKGTLRSIWAHYKGALDVVYLFVMNGNVLPDENGAPEYPPIPLAKGTNGGACLITGVPISLEAGCNIVISSAADVDTRVAADCFIHATFNNG